MKRETRPFIVEVKRGSKKQPAPFLPSPPDGPQEERSPLQRAEEILFSREPESKEGSPSARTGRILETVDEERVAEPEPTPAEPPRRRGRPPGSKNRPLAAHETKQRGPKGRPRLAPEVRRLKLTPELVSAAMETIAKLASNGSPQEAQDGHDSRVFASREGSPALETQTRRPRGRPPRKTEPLFNTAPAEAVAETADERDAAPLRPRRRSSTRAQSGEEALAGGLRRSDFARLFKPGERWKGRMRLRALARRRRDA